MASNARKWTGTLVSMAALALSGCASTARPAPQTAVTMPTGPYLYVLGTAQDGAFPQAGCFKPHCLRGWEHPELAEPTVSLGWVDPGSRVKYMLEATPNFPQQLYRLQKEAPDAQYRFAGVYLTHAHIGHYVGIMHFGREVMGAQDVPG